MQSKETAARHKHYMLQKSFFVFPPMIYPKSVAKHAYTRNLSEKYRSTVTALKNSTQGVENRFPLAVAARFL